VRVFTYFQFYTNEDTTETSPMKRLLLKYKRKSETWLLDAYLRKGDESAFCELYKRHTDKLVGFFMKKCGGDRNVCDDLVQETFHKLLNSKAFKGNSIDEMGSYIITIAFTTWSEYYKKCQQIKENKSEWKRTQYQEFETDINTNKEYRIKILNSAINKLPSKDQIRAIKLWQSGKSYREIAGVMGKTLAEVTNLIYRAKRNLRGLIDM